jgi:hypothetical protein
VGTPLLPRDEVWSELREADDELRSLIGRVPSAAHLRRKFSALRRRLSGDPPADKPETVQRLRAIRDECSGELARFRTAVDRALHVAERRDW